MGKKNRPPQDLKSSPDDSARSLFRAAIGDVQPLGSDNRIHQRGPGPRPRLRPKDSAEQLLHDQLLAHETVLSGSGSSDDLNYRRPGVQNTVLRKLRRGQFPRQEELDLHGLTVEKARTELATFLVDCIHKNLRCVRIIHGKGLRSGERGAVLKPRLGRWLQQRDEVAAFCPARRDEGGSGAIYVLLRRPKT